MIEWRRFSLPLTLTVGLMYVLQYVSQSRSVRSQTNTGKRGLLELLSSKYLEATVR